MSFRIAFGGIHIESTTFTNYISKEEDFRIREGKALLNYYPWLEKYEGIDALPIIHARAIPGGKVCNKFFIEWKKKFLNMIEEQNKIKKIDGVLLDIHGAMSVQAINDAEGVLALELRELLGEKVVISTTMDLHGNVSDVLFENCDLLTCYRTAPHIDANETRERAFLNMIRVLKSQDCDKVYKVKIDVPILLPGEKTSTEVEPGRSLYKKLDVICENPDILDASIWMGFPWADEKRCHSAIVVTGMKKDIIKKTALNLSLDFWNERENFKFVGPVDSTVMAINTALKSTEHPFFISDTGDNPGAGGSGDLNIVLKEFVNHNTKKRIEKNVLFASIFDKLVIEQNYNKPVDSLVKVSLGGNIDKEFGDPLNLEVVINSKFNDAIAGRGMIVKKDNIYIIVTENRYQYGTLKAFNVAGVKHFDEYDIIVVKMGYLEPDLSNAAKGWVMALSKGAVSQDLININYKHREKPLFPFEDFDFNPIINLK